MYENEHSACTFHSFAEIRIQCDLGSKREFMDKTRSYLLWCCSLDVEEITDPFN